MSLAFLLEVALAFFALIALAVVRNFITLEIFLKANYALRAYLQREFNAARSDVSEIDALYARLGTTSYDAILFNVLIWTPRQAFPWLYELIEARRVE